MPPRIVRPRSDRAPWLAAAASGLAALVLGYVGAARVFDPGPQAPSEAAEPMEARPAIESEDAGVAAPVPVPAVAEASAPVVEPAAPRVPVRVGRTVVQSCGDGEELNIPGARCTAVPGLEEALQRRVQQLGSCPGAETSARTPEATLSIGLRVDFQRRRVTALPGRSSSLANALTYVACARSVFEHTEDLWQLSAPHLRYLFFFSVRFGPLTGSAAHAHATETPAPAASAPAREPTAPTPTPAAPAAAREPAAPAPERRGAALRPEPATLVWDRVMLRDAPRDGAIVHRLARGAEVTVIGRLGDWYQVRYHGHEGWLFGASIGR
jgi:hypothetical protein